MPYEAKIKMYTHYGLCKKRVVLELWGRVVIYSLYREYPFFKIFLNVQFCVPLLNFFYFHILLELDSLLTFVYDDVIKRLD